MDARGLRGAVSGHCVPPVMFAAEQITRGLLRGEFEPFFQPQVEIGTGHVVGAEALARWLHPQHGVVAPCAFMRPLLQSGCGDMLTRHMLRKAAAMCRIARAAGHDTTIAVNVCLESLADVTFAQQVLSIVRSEGADPHCIVLEVTESVATVELGTVPENLAFLRIMGFGLALDDNGTGSSSLRQLTWIPFAELKIDPSLVTHAARRESTRAMLASSIDLAKKLNLRAVAVGVETREDWDVLRDLKCDVAQGYYIARPMSADAYLDWLGDGPRMRNPGSLRSSSARRVR